MSGIKITFPLEDNLDDIIKLEDVELNLPLEVIEARDYQYNLL